jgi:hypothetical protein
MSPKPPLPPPPKINLPETPTITPPRFPSDEWSSSALPDLGPGLFDVLTDVTQGPSTSQPGTSQGQLAPDGPAINVPRQVITAPQPPLRTNDSLSLYKVSTRSANTLPAPDGEGFRIHANRRYVDVQDEGTVLVGYDNSTGTYRAKLRNETTPTGPQLQLNDDGKTWRRASHGNSGEGEPGSALHRPRVYIDTTHYVWNPGTRNHHGYIVLHRKKGLDDFSGPQTHLAFQDAHGAFVKVDSTLSPLDQPADKLAAWTDRDLWDFYGLHGDEITRFRDEAAITGKKPQWATLRQEKLEKPYLLAELRRWLAPYISQDDFNGRMAPLDYSVQQWAAQLDKVSIFSTADRQLGLLRRKLNLTQEQVNESVGEIYYNVPDYVKKAHENGLLRNLLIDQLRVRISDGATPKSQEAMISQLQPYNLSTRQLSRLLADVQADGRFAQWAEDHKHSSMDGPNNQAFNEAYEELLPEILTLRNFEVPNVVFRDHFTPPYFEKLLIKAGYKWNEKGFMYRDDIPAVFRGDDRSPFVFYDEGMIPRVEQTGRSTTQFSVSKTFHMAEATQTAYQGRKHFFTTPNPITKPPATATATAATAATATVVTKERSKVSASLICSTPEASKLFRVKKTARSTCVNAMSI